MNDRTGNNEQAFEVIRKLKEYFTDHPEIILVKCERDSDIMKTRKGKPTNMIYFLEEIEENIIKLQAEASHHENE